MGSRIKAIDGAARHRQHGFTYLMLLLWVAIAGVMLAALGTSWSLMARRERETEWLWRGAQFQRALASYAQASAGLQTQSGSAPAVGGNLPGTGFDLSNAALMGSSSGSASGSATTAAGANMRATRRGASTTPATGMPDSASAPDAATPAPGAASAGAGSGGPLELQDLLEDRRSGKLVRHLRQIYRDPLTGSYLWGLDRGPDGRIRGIYSLSNAVPLRTTLGIEHYRDLVFRAKTSAPPAVPPEAASAASAAASEPVLRRRAGLGF